MTAALLPPVDLPLEPVKLDVKPVRHRWDYDSERRIAAADSPTGSDQNEKPCILCGLFRITVHPPKPNIPFRMWRWGDDGKQFKAGRTPVCQPRAGA